VRECAAASGGGSAEREEKEEAREGASWAAAFPAAVTVQVLRTAAVATAAYAAYTPTAMASEYVWLPRRHHRRMDEWKRTIPAVERVKVPHPLSLPLVSDSAAYLTSPPG
jgi:hypothetical protein